MNSRDVYALLLCLYREARGEPMEAKRAVYHVIMNRVADSRPPNIHPNPGWPNTPYAVIIQPKQFSSFNANDPNYSRFPYLDTLSLADCASVVDNPGDDPTGGANFYHSYPDGDSRWPSWATKDTFTCRIGHFNFYKR